MIDLDYYRYIDVPNQHSIIERYKEYTFEKTNKTSFIVNHSEYDWVAAQIKNISELSDFKIRVVLMMSQPGLNDRGIHVDGKLVKPGDNWALNIPIYNCENSDMVWYDGLYEKRTENSNHLTWNSEPVEVERVKLIRPLLVRTNKPHTVINYSPVSRSILSIRFIE